MGMMEKLNDKNQKLIITCSYCDKIREIDKNKLKLVITGGVACNKFIFNNFARERIQCGSRFVG